MPTTLPDRFPILTEHTRRKEKLAEAVEDIKSGLDEGRIRNKTLQEAKSILGRAVEEAWSKTVNDRFTYGGQWQMLPEDVRDLEMSLNSHSLHSMISVDKKVRKSGLSHPMIDVIKDLLEEALPLAMAAQELKSVVVKGRAAPTGAPAKPKNPNQVRGTCSCCIRDIATKPGGMAHHGYTRPGYGEQTSSCPGVRFPNLEVSTEGLIWMISSVKGQRDRLQERLNKAPAKDEITLSRRSGGRLLQKTLHRDEPGFDRALKGYIRNLEVEVKMADQHKDFLETELDRRTPNKEVPETGVTKAAVSSAYDLVDVAARENDLDAACRLLQNAIGQDGGDIAGVHFAGDRSAPGVWAGLTHEQRVQDLTEYLDLEMIYAKDPENETPTPS